jgi:hypothetical protein
MPTVTPQWMLRRLAARAARIVKRRAQESPVIAAYLQTTVPTAEAPRVEAGSTDGALTKPRWSSLPRVFESHSSGPQSLGPNRPAGRRGGDQARADAARQGSLTLKKRFDWIMVLCP